MTPQHGVTSFSMHSYLADTGTARRIGATKIPQSHLTYTVKQMQGSYQEAYDVLDSSYEKSTQQFQRAAVCGFLRHAQVSEVGPTSSWLAQLCMVPQYKATMPLNSNTGADTARNRVLR